MIGASMILISVTIVAEDTLQNLFMHHAPTKTFCTSVDDRILPRCDPLIGLCEFDAVSHGMGDDLCPMGLCAMANLESNILRLRNRLLNPMDLWYRNGSAQSVERLCAFLIVARDKDMIVFAIFF